MVANVLERQGIEPEDWEQSRGTNYRVEPLKPPTWVVRPPPGQHLATLDGVPVDEWSAEPAITPEELPRWREAPVKPAATVARSCTSESFKWPKRP